MPYTYLIECIPTGQRYYGVRFAKNCDPSDLWVTYFTSSKYVHRLILRFGLSAFKVSVRRKFDNAQDAIDWEFRVLNKLRVREKAHWLNMCVGKIKASKLEMTQKHNWYMRGRKRSKEEIQKRKDNYEKTAWVNKDGKSKLVRETDIPYYRSIGFLVGRDKSFVSETYVAMCQNRRGDRNPAWGKTRLDLAERNRQPKAWVTKDGVDRLILKTEFDNFSADGWRKGRSKTFTKNNKPKKGVEKTKKKINKSVQAEILRLKKTV